MVTAEDHSVAPVNMQRAHQTLKTSYHVTGARLEGVWSNLWSTSTKSNCLVTCSSGGWVYVDVVKWILLLHRIVQWLVQEEDHY